MHQQSYCPPREYQAPAHGHPMYPGPPTPWETPYEPAGDVSCFGPDSSERHLQAQGGFGLGYASFPEEAAFGFHRPPAAYSTGYF